MTIACIIIQRFAVEAERQRHKNTGARLILLGESTVHDCSLGAEVSKVHRGMRMSEAIGLCPNAIVLPTDAPYYDRLFQQVLDFLETFSPVVEGSTAGTAFLSLDGLQTPPVKLVGEIVAGINSRFGFLASAGIAEAKFVARVAAAVSRPGVVKPISAGEEGQFLAPLPIDHLPASDAMRWRLSMLGLSTIGDVARLPLGAIQAQFGPEGKRCWELAQGMDDEQLVPRVTEETVMRRMQLPAAAVTLDTILAGTEKLVRASYDSLGGNRWVRTATVRFLPEGGGVLEIPVVFREAILDPGNAWFVVRNAILKSPPERPIEEIEVELIGLAGESGKQATMFEGKGKLWRQVEEAVRQLDTQQNEDDAPTIGKIVPLSPRSRIPERRAALADFGDGP